MFTHIEAPEAFVIRTIRATSFISNTDKRWWAYKYPQIGHRPSAINILLCVGVSALAAKLKMKKLQRRCWKREIALNYKWSLSSGISSPIVCCCCCWWIPSCFPPLAQSLYPLLVRNYPIGRDFANIFERAAEERYRRQYTSANIYIPNCVHELWPTSCPVAGIIPLFGGKQLIFDDTALRPTRQQSFVVSCISSSNGPSLIWN